MRAAVVLAYDTGLFDRVAEHGRMKQSITPRRPESHGGSFQRDLPPS